MRCPGVGFIHCTRCLLHMLALAVCPIPRGFSMLLAPAALQSSCASMDPWNSRHGARRGGHVGRGEWNGDSAFGVADPPEL